MKRLTLATYAVAALGYANPPGKTAAPKETTPTAPKETTPAAPKRIEPQVLTGKLPDNFTPPEPTRGGGATKYPINDLVVGGAIGVKNKTKRELVGVVNRANVKYSTRAKDASGKTKVVAVDREFYAVDVDADTAKSLVGTDFEGSTVLIIRRK